MSTYLVIADRSALAQYLRTEFGNLGAGKPNGPTWLRLRREAVRYNAALFIVPTACFTWSERPASGLGFKRRRDAEWFANRVRSIADYCDGRRGAPRTLHTVEVQSV